MSPKNSSKNIPPQKRPRADWTAIEGDYRSGAKSVAQIADEHGISQQRIYAKAKKMGWKRDLVQRVKKTVEEKLLGIETGKTYTVAEESRIVERSSSEAASAVKSHRRQAAKLLEVNQRLLEISRKAVSLLRPEDTAALKDYAQILKNSAQALDKATNVSRKTFNLYVGTEEASDSLNEVLKTIAGVTRGLPNHEQDKIR